MSAAAQESFYRDQILSNAAVLFPTSFRIVLRQRKTDGKDTFDALLLEGETHKLLLAGLPSFHIHEALFNLLGASSKEIAGFLQTKADKEAQAEGKEPGERSLPKRV
ncbi:hypothetical protein AAFC00_005089 [Neodothiora populina]|uniref:Uncharacterized protein n=1 Tax=Neodothiora populina TaxID=2781224 RepID=A0ABR3PJZ3_9PEZI